MTDLARRLAARAARDLARHGGGLRAGHALRVRELGRSALRDGQRRRCRRASRSRARRGRSPRATTATGSRSPGSRTCSTWSCSGRGPAATTPPTCCCTRSTRRCCSRCCSRRRASASPSALVAALFALHPLHVEVVAWVSERKELLSHGLRAALDARLRRVDAARRRAALCGRSARVRGRARGQADARDAAVRAAAARLLAARARAIGAPAAAREAAAVRALGRGVRGRVRVAAARAHDTRPTLPLGLRLANAAVALRSAISRSRCGRAGSRCCTRTRTRPSSAASPGRPRPWSRRSPGSSRSRRRVLAARAAALPRGGLALVPRDARARDRPRPGRTAGSRRPLQLRAARSACSSRSSWGARDAVAALGARPPRGAASQRQRSRCSRSAPPASASHARARVWRDSESLYLASLAATPRNPVLLYNLGVVQAQQGRVEDAARSYDAALAIDPEHAAANDNLGNIRLRARQPRRGDRALPGRAAPRSGRSSRRSRTSGACSRGAASSPRRSRSSSARRALAPGDSSVRRDLDAAARGAAGGTAARARGILTQSDGRDLLEKPSSSGTVDPIPAGTPCRRIALSPCRTSS